MTDRHEAIQKSYRQLGGDLESVKESIMLCHAYGGGSCHVELTTLVVPGFNDGEDEMAEEASWVASLARDIPLHLTRFFPRWQMQDRPPHILITNYAMRDPPPPCRRRAAGAFRRASGERVGGRGEWGFCPPGGCMPTLRASDPG